MIGLGFKGASLLIFDHAPSGCSSAGICMPSSAQAGGLWPCMQVSHFYNVRGKESARDRFDAIACGQEDNDNSAG
ncbi:MAG: hypothetical protein C4586_08845 [Anaerolineaceae bacterium]|nr:MAG: hypothetical protein C4586_08845 [Anaerolineaceae bacterium]